MKKAFWIILALLLISIALNVWQCSNQPEPSVVIERDTVWKDTTIYQPTPAETIDIGKTVYIRIPYNIIETDTIHDSIEVPVPIYQKRYDDSLYTAWVSGFEPNLDSIRLYQPTITETVTQTIVKPAPLITFGIQTGGGVGIFSRQPDVYIGFGGQINFWRR